VEEEDLRRNQADLCFHLEIWLLHESNSRVVVVVVVVEAAAAAAPHVHLCLALSDKLQSFLETQESYAVIRQFSKVHWLFELMFVLLCL